MNVPGRTGHPFTLQSPTDQQAMIMLICAAECRSTAPRPGALQHGGALYCACERQRTTGATRQNLLYVNANVCIH
ncbi:TPA: hypothetical protein ISA44_005072 [Escherichia coli]|nr:hypothetical protein [Escherichia coli]